MFLFGFALLGLSDSVIEFSQTWMWLSIVIYVLAIGLSHGVLMPAVKRMGVLMHEMARRTAAGRRAAARRRPRWPRSARSSAWRAPILDLSMIAILFLMVYKPGF